MDKEKLNSALKDLGGFFKERREQFGLSHEHVAMMIDDERVNAATIKAIEHGRYVYTIDLHLSLMQVLNIKPYFSYVDDEPGDDYRTRRNDDPRRYHGFYMADNLLLYPDQAGIVKLTHPRLFIRFNYGDSVFAGYEDWKNNITKQEWLDPDDKPTNEDEIDYHITDCWNFLALHEREEENLDDPTEGF